MTRLSLASLQLPDGTELDRTGELDRTAVKSLLRFGSGVTMVVASVDKPLRWIADDEMREFWKTDASIRIAQPDLPARLEDFPGDRLYWASRWTHEASGRVVIALEEAH